MSDADQVERLETSLIAETKRLNESLAAASTEEALREVLESSTAFVRRLRAEREQQMQQLLDVWERLVKGGRPRQAGAFPMEAEAELREDSKLRQEVIAAYDREIAAGERLVDRVYGTLDRWSLTGSGSAPAAVVAGAAQAIAESRGESNPDPVAVGQRPALANRSKWSRLGIVGGVGLAALVGFGALLARPTSVPAPTPTVAATVVNFAPAPKVVVTVVDSATEAADLWTKVPEPTNTAEPTPEGLPPTATDTPEPTATHKPTVTPTPQPVAAKNANLRSGPGTNYLVVGSVTAGQKLDIIERTTRSDWYRLRSGAWIAAFLVLYPAINVPVARVIPTPPPPTATRRPPTATPAPVLFGNPAPPVSPGCCKVCRNSKACGNSCISWSKTCHQPPGCACQG